MSTPDRIQAIQARLREADLDGWLLYDFRRSNPLAYRVLQFGREGVFTRRWFYWVPAHGEPVKIVAALEQWNLDSLPGQKIVYRSWRELTEALAQVVRPKARVAMEYSPLAAVPVVSRVDAGTVELVRSLGADVVSSADLIQHFEARLSPEQWASHCQAAAHLVEAHSLVAEHIAAALSEGLTITEYTVQQFLGQFLTDHGMVADHGANVSVNANASNPHYEPSAERATPIRQGDLILIDYWGKIDRPGAIMADYTWMYFAGDSVPDEYARVFETARQARDAAIALVRERVQAGQPLHGYEVDDAARGVIVAASLGDYFIHRTGHNIGEDTHGNGANIDNLETQDSRLLIPGALFSVEPGIYLPAFGVRTEVNVYIGEDQTVHVTGVPQPAIRALF